MAVRWLIFSAGGQLGPWSASRIRDELRGGRIDPFDLVAIEGSQIKRPLVEVDEIFETAQVQSAAIIEEQSGERQVASSDVRVQKQDVDTAPLLKIVTSDEQRGPGSEASKLSPNKDSESLESHLAAITDCP